MVLGHRHRSASLGSKGNNNTADDSADEDETVVSSEQGNVLQHIISQLRPGADLSRITLPTFILEPRSMLERITNFMAHPEILLSLPTIDDPVQRFVAVTKFYLSGWHIKPPGVKKPLNPILGETFTGYWDYPDGTRGYYISEQTSHHPPKSSYFFMAPSQRIRIDGTLKPRSKFLGNSVGSFMEGIAVMRFLNRNERYFITQPNMYARGILFGKMKYELGDHAQVSCPETGLSVDIEFKVKGWMGGSYNSIGGFIKDTKSNKNLYELSGFWHGEMTIKDLSTGKKEVLFDATRAKPSFPKSRPLEEQGERESQRLWDTTTKAIRKADHVGATEEKSRIEDEQRREASERGDKSAWQPKLFKKAPPGDEEKLDWIIDAEVYSNAPAEKQVEQILAIAPILPGQEQKQKQQQSQPPPPPQKQSQDNHPQTSQQPDQNKPLPSAPQPQQPSHQKSQSQQLPTRVKPDQGHSDLIDFGQHDSAAQHSTPQQQQQQQQQRMQEPRVPAGRSEAGGMEPIRRMDSLEGGEDRFVDAET